MTPYDAFTKRLEPHRTFVLVVHVQWLIKGKNDPWKRWSLYEQYSPQIFQLLSVLCFSKSSLKVTLITILYKLIQTHKSNLVS